MGVYQEEGGPRSEYRSAVEASKTNTHLPSRFIDRPHRLYHIPLHSQTEHREDKQRDIRK